MAPRRIGEFELIARYFAPLARSFEGAGGLRSDNALLPADPQHDLVVKTDTVVAGVHFLADERPERLAAKALRVCLSDLAAGGATPFVYQLSLALPAAWRESWVAGFARGLAADQRRYGIVLCGGDTVVTPGPLTVTVTAIGKVAKGRGRTRAGARVGHELWVSGTVGDGALGLLAARGELGGLSRADRATLEERYRLPLPRTTLGRRLADIASATADISDGLLADAGHIAVASGVGLEIDRESIPISPAARRALELVPSLWSSVVAGGDDYELLMAVPQEKVNALRTAARAARVPVRRVGRFTRDEGVVLREGGRVVRATRKGYVHF